MFEKITAFVVQLSARQNPDKSRRSKLLHDVLNINLVISLIILILCWMSGLRQSVLILISLFFLLLILFLGFLSKAGKVDLAARVLVYAYIFIASVLLIYEGGLHSPSVSIYFLAILLTFIFLESIDLIINSFLVILVSGGIAYAEYSEWLAPSIDLNFFTEWLILGAVCVAIIAFKILPKRRQSSQIVDQLQEEHKTSENEQQIRSLYSTAQRQAQELALLERTRLALARELDLDSVIRTVVEGVAETFGYTLVSLYLLQNKHLVLQHQVGYKQTISEIQLTEGITGRVVRTQKPILIEDVQTDRDFLGAIKGIVSEVCVPLFDRGQVAGILNVESTQGIKLTDADLQLMIAISEHVSIAIERACLYNEVRRSEERYRTLAESAPDAIFIHSTEGKLTYINSTGALQFGAQPEQLVGKRLDEILEDRAASNRLKDIQQVVVSKQPIQTEDFLSFPNHSAWYETKLVPICEENGFPFAVLGIARDITERKRVEAELKERARELGALNALGRRVIACLSIEEVIQAALAELMPIAAPDFALLFLLEGQELVLSGFSPQNSPYPQQFSLVFKLGECLCGLAAQTGEDVFSDDIQLDNRCTLGHCKNAGVKSFAGLPLKAENRIIGVLGLASFRARNFKTASGFLETISSQIAAGLQNAMLHQQVQIHAHALEDRVHQRTFDLEMKNRELETFSYSVSHDLKAPLRGIDGYSLLLIEEYAKNLDDQGKLYLENIRYGIKKMSQLIDDLLDYSRLERRAVLRKNVDPSQIVNSIVAEWMKNPTNRAKFSIHIPCKVVNADPESLSQALRNLIDNAVKFSHEVADPVIEIGGQESDKSCVLWVHDNGIGFDMQYSDRIFEIFQRLNRDEDYPGTGIGLAMVKKAMERMGGRAWAESTPGLGSIFFIEMPK